MRTRGVLVRLLAFAALAVAPVYALDIDTAAAWSGTVVLDEWVEINAGGALTIMPGTTVVFDEIPDTARQGSIFVNDGGTMNALGTLENPITFTAAGDLQFPGGWAGIEFRDGAAGTMDHCLLEYAGQWLTEAALVINNATVTVQDTTVQNCLQYGIELGQEGNAAALSDVTVMNCGLSAIRQRTSNMSPSYANLSLSGNLWDGVEIEGTSITQTVTWTNTSAPYIIDGWVRPESGGALNISAGVTVQFKDTDSAAQSQINALDGGSFQAIGTEMNPVTFTSAFESPAAGDWNTLSFADGSSGELNHCVIEYAGQFFNTAGVFVGSSDVAMSNCTVTACLGDGIRLGGIGITPMLDGLTVADCGGAALYLETEDMNPAIGNTLQFTGNLHNGVYVFSGGADMTGTATWTVTSVPYILEDWLVIGSGASLSLMSGVTVQFAPASSFLQSLIRVLNGGTFQAAGSPGDEVTFTSYQESPAPGDWAFLEVQDGGALTLDHAVLEYAGHAGNGALLVEGPGATVNDTSIRYALDEGLVVAEDATGSTFDGLTVAQCGGWPVLQFGLEAGPAFANLSCDNNAPGDALLVDTLDATITTAVTLSDVGTPYALRSWTTFTTGSSLTVMPGTTVQFAPDNSALQSNIVLQSGSTLTADGSAESPIHFTSAQRQPQPGDWAYISIESGASATLDFCLIEYGGQWFSPGMLGIGESSVALTNSILRYSASEGLDIFGGAQPTLTGNQILGNAYGALNRTPANVVDATGTWWGDPTGPFNSSTNPDGIGNEVSDGFLFNPYMDAPTGNPVLNAGPQSLSFDFEGAGASVVVFNSGGGTLDWDVEVVAEGNWLMATATKGEGGIVSVTASENETTQSRIGTVRIADPFATASPVDVTVVQEAGPEPGTLEEEAAEGLLEDFANLDTNGDGGLAYLEVQAWLNDYLGLARGGATPQALFDTLNTEDDDVLRVGELRQSARFSALHAADTNGDGAWSLTELLRVIQLFNATAYSCATNGGATEDGYRAEPEGETSCTPHASDYQNTPWHLGLTEVLRAVQFFNFGRYHYCPEGGTDDGYCPGDPG